MKKRIFLVFLILLAQIVLLFCLSFSREREYRNNSTFILECRTYDPRDILRGHYLPLSFKLEENIPFSKFDVELQKKLYPSFSQSLKSENPYIEMPRDAVFWIILAPDEKTGFWEVESITQTDPKISFNKNPEKRRVALSGSPNAYVSLRSKNGGNPPSSVEEIFSKEKSYTIPFHNLFPNRRFYLSEEKAKFFDEHFRGQTKHTVSAELYLDKNGTPIPKRLFVDGVEYN